MGQYGDITAYRVAIEGLGIEAVTDAAMEQTVSGVARVNGLLREGLRIQDSSDLLTATIDASPCTITIVDRQVDSVWTGWLAHQPDVITYLTTDLSTSATTIALASTTGIAAGDYIHMGTETVLVGTVASGTSLTGCTRAQWGTVAQAHYAADGARLGAAPVSLTRPLSLEGRRVVIYRYGEGDSLTGSGTQIWRGVLTSDAALSDDRATWTLRAQPLSDLLSRDIGSYLDEPLSVRGIYYPAGDGRFVMDLWETSSTRYSSDAGTDSEQIVLVGFWETQQDFVADLDAALQTAIAAASWSLQSARASVDDASGAWRIDYVADGTTPRWLRARLSAGAALIDQGVSPEAVVRSSAITASQHVSMIAGLVDEPGQPGILQRAAGAAQVPRGVFGTTRFIGAAASNHTLYPDHEGVITSTLDTVSIEWPTETVDAIVGEVDASAGSFAVRPTVAPSIYGYVPGALPQITVAKSFVYGDDLAAFVSYLATTAPTEANRGGMPMMSASDFDSSEMATSVDAAHAGDVLFASRWYAGSQSIELGDIISADCRLLGLYPAIKSTGVLTLIPIGLPADTEQADFALAPLTDWSWERNKFGSVNEVTIRTGYMIADDDYTGRTWIARDAYAIATRPRGQDSVIEPKSKDVDPELWTQEHAVRIAARLTGLLGRPYSVIECETTEAYWQTAVVGATCRVTFDSMPDTVDGGRGISSRIALVIGRDWDVSRGRIALTMIMRDSASAGYAPTVTVSSTSLVSSGIYDAVVTFTDPEGIASTAPAGAKLSDYYTTDSLLDLMDWDVASQTPQTCVVTAVTDATMTLRIKFGGTPTLSGTRYLRFQDSAAAHSSQLLYAFYGEDDGRLTTAAGSQAAQRYSS